MQLDSALMQYNNLGGSGLKVSAISFGCWTMGGLNFVDGNPNGWADVDENEVTAGVRAGLDAGVTHFDNADVYGNGRAERMLKRVFDKLGVAPDSVTVATKVGHFPGTAPHAYDALHVRGQAEQSLANLGRESLDLYYFHHGNFGDSDQYLEGAVTEVQKMVDEGKIRYAGLSAYSADDFERLVPKIKSIAPNFPLAALQSWANALDYDFIKPGSRVQKVMDEHNLSYVAFSPLAQGRLLDKFDPENPPQFEPGDHRKGNDAFKAEAIVKLQPKLEKLKARFGDSTQDLASMALGFILAQPRVGCAIPGFRNERQAKCNIAGEGQALSNEDVQFVIETLG